MRRVDTRVDAGLACSAPRGQASRRVSTRHATGVRHITAKVCEALEDLQLALSGFEDVCAIVVVFELHLAATVGYFPVEFDDQMFAFDRELRTGAVAKVEAAVQACSADDINCVWRLDLEDLAIRAGRRAAAVLVVEEGQRVGARGSADLGPIGNSGTSAPLVGVEHFDRTRAPGVFAEREDGKREDEERKPLH
jgi:hypothetical protein